MKIKFKMIKLNNIYILKDLIFLIKFQLKINKLKTKVKLKKHNLITFFF